MREGAYNKDEGRTRAQGRPDSIGRRKVFTPGDLKKIVEALPQPSTPARPRNYRTSAYTSRASMSAYDEAMELLDKKARGAKSARAGTGVVSLDKARARRPRKSDD